MRHLNLLRSVQRLLPEGEQVLAASYGYARHRLSLLYALAAGSAIFVLVSLLGGYTVPSRAVLGGVAGAVAIAATTEYRIFARTTTGFVLLRGSRIRLAATAVLRRLEPDTTVAPVGGNLITVEWEIDGRLYSVPKRADAHLARVFQRSE